MGGRAMSSATRKKLSYVGEPCDESLDDEYDAPDDSLDRRAFREGLDPIAAAERKALTTGSHVVLS